MSDSVEPGSDCGGSSSGSSGYSRSAAIFRECPARGHDPQPGAALDQTGHLRSGRHDLLEVVQEQERLLVSDQRGDAFAERPSLGFLHVQRVRERGEKLRRIGDVGQRDERDTVQELGREQPAELDDDARLSDTAGTRDRDNPMFVRQLDEGRQVVGAADQWSGRVGQVARQAGEPLAVALQRPRIRHHDAFGRDRVELERASDVLEPEPPEAYDADVAPVLDLVVSGVGQHHAARHRKRLDPGGDVHGVAGEPLGLDDHVAHVDADAYRYFVRRELALDRDCGEHRSERAREHAQAAIPESLDDRPAERVVVGLEGTHVPVALVESQAFVRLDQRRVPDHVGEHHRDKPTIEPLTQDSSLGPPGGTGASAL